MFGLFLPLWKIHKVNFGRRFRDFVDAEIVPNLDRDNLVLPDELRVAEDA